MLIKCWKISPLLLSPLDLWNLWNPFNRLRIIKGKFGCTQIRASSCCSSEKKNNLNFFGVWNIFPRGSIGLLTKMGKTNLWPIYFISRGTFLAKNGDYRWELVGVFGSNVLLALLIDPWKWPKFPDNIKHFLREKSKHIWAKIGQNLVYAIWPTIAELYAKNHFPIANANP